MSKVYAVYDFASTVVRGIFSTRQKAETFCMGGESFGGEKFDMEDVGVFSITVDKPIDIGYDYTEPLPIEGQDE